MTQRTEITDFLRWRRDRVEGPAFRVIDVGCPGMCAGCWTEGLVDAVVDLPSENLPSEEAFQHYGVAPIEDCGLRGDVFNIDFDYPPSWTKLFAHVEQFGKFDFAISTHVIEDLNNDPRIFADLLGQIAKSGFLATPSKFAELSRNERAPLSRQGSEASWRGYYHHRWIMTLHSPSRDASVAPQLHAVPKLSLFELDNAYDLLFSLPSYNLAVQWFLNEIAIVWNDQLPVQVFKTPQFLRATHFAKSAHNFLVNSTLNEDRHLLFKASRLALEIRPCIYAGHKEAVQSCWSKLMASGSVTSSSARYNALVMIPGTLGAVLNKFWGTPSIA